MDDRDPESERGTPVNRWDAAAYDDAVGFVPEYGESVVALLDPQPGERVLDLGCGTGHLTAAIADAVGPEGLAVGVDSAPDMVAAAREEYPDCRFACVDAREFALDDVAGGPGFDDTSGDPGTDDTFGGPETDDTSDAPGTLDAVFSNAALHWIPRDDQDDVTERVAEALGPGGRFVAELGGRGNVDAVVSAALAELRERGHGDVDHPWYFPTVGEHAAVLERHGFEVRLARLFDRPTELDGGGAGLRNWLDVFGDSLFAGLSDAERGAVVAAVEDRLRDDLWDPETETWTADYRRLRFVAVRGPD